MVNISSRLAMTQARRVIVSPNEVGVYHCVSRCVRRAYLCGFDSYSGKNYEHRRRWVRDRLKELSGLFGVEVFSYAVMSNHLHVVLRTRPDWADSWTNDQVAERWCRLFRGKEAIRAGRPYDEQKYNQVRNDAARIQLYRDRLKDVSWLMRCLNESLARRANAEDRCGGRFWGGRFKCQRLLDRGAILACMAYVDLNPVRARLADRLEESEFTSVFDRLMANRAEKRLGLLGNIERPTSVQQREIDKELKWKSEVQWLLPIDGAESPLTGIDEEYYFSLVEWTGKMIRKDKPGFIPAGIAGVLDRFDLDAASWAQNVQSYGTLFHRVAGSVDSILSQAKKTGQNWFRGMKSSQHLYRSKVPVVQSAVSQRQ